jgi:hypothetical protein
MNHSIQLSIHATVFSFIWSLNERKLVWRNKLHTIALNLRAVLLRAAIPPCQACPSYIKTSRELHSDPTLPFVCRPILLTLRMCAVQQILFRQLYQLAGIVVILRLQGADGWKRPTWAASTLQKKYVISLQLPCRSTSSSRWLSVGHVPSIIDSFGCDTIQSDLISTCVSSFLCLRLNVTWLAPSDPQSVSECMHACGEFRRNAWMHVTSRLFPLRIAVMPLTKIEIYIHMDLEASQFAA